MSDEFESDSQQSDGGGLRRQLEQALADKRAVEEARDAAVQEALERGRQEAQRRYEALEVFGKDRPGLADAWMSKNLDEAIDEEKAKAFAAEFGVTLGEEAKTEPAPEPVAPEVKEAAEAFARPVAKSGQTGQTYSPEDIRKIGLRDEAEALRLIAEGAMQTE